MTRTDKKSRRPWLRGQRRDVRERLRNGVTRRTWDTARSPGADQLFKVILPYPLRGKFFCRPRAAAAVTPKGRYGWRQPAPCATAPRHPAIPCAANSSVAHGLRQPLRPKGVTDGDSQPLAPQRHAIPLSPARQILLSPTGCGSRYAQRALRMATASPLRHSATPPRYPLRGKFF